jgi:hypothetical protein
LALPSLGDTSSDTLATRRANQRVERVGRLLVHRRSGRESTPEGSWGHQDGDVPHDQAVPGGLAQCPVQHRPARATGPDRRAQCLRVSASTAHYAAPIRRPPSPEAITTPSTPAGRQPRTPSLSTAGRGRSSIVHAQRAISTTKPLSSAPANSQAQDPRSTPLPRTSVRTAGSCAADRWPATAEPPADDHAHRSQGTTSEHAHRSRTDGPRTSVQPRTEQLFTPHLTDSSGSNCTPLWC